jgi:hypothetical protein
MGALSVKTWVECWVVYWAVWRAVQLVAWTGDSMVVSMAEKKVARTAE